MPTFTIHNPACCSDCNAQLELSLQNAALIQTLIRANAEHARRNEGRRNPAPPTKGTAAAIQLLARRENEKRVGTSQNLANSSANLEKLGRYLEMEMRVRKNLNPWEAQRVMGTKAQELLDAVSVTTKEEKGERVGMQEEKKNEGIERQEQDDLRSLRSFVGSSPSLDGLSPKPIIEAISPSYDDSIFDDYQEQASDDSAEVDGSTPLPASRPSCDYSISMPEEVELSAANDLISSFKDEGESGPQIAPSRLSSDSPSAPANSSPRFNSLVEKLEGLDVLFVDDTKTATPTVNSPPPPSYPSNLSLDLPFPPLSEEEEQLTNTASTSPISPDSSQSSEAEKSTDTDAVHQPTFLFPPLLPICPVSPLGFDLEQEQQADATSTAQQQGQELEDDSIPQLQFSPPSSNDSDSSDSFGDSVETWIDSLEEVFSPPNSPPLEPSSFPLPHSPPQFPPQHSPPLEPSSIPLPPSPPPSPPGLTSLLTPPGITALRTIYAYFSLPMTFPPTQLNLRVKFGPWITFPRPKRRKASEGVRSINRSAQDMRQMREVERLYWSVDWESAWELEKTVGMRDKDGMRVEKKAGRGRRGEEEEDGRDGGRDGDGDKEGKQQVRRYRTHGLKKARFPWTMVPIPPVGERGEGNVVAGSGGEGEGEGERKDEREGENEGEGEKTIEGEKEGEQQSIPVTLQLNDEQKAELLLGLGIAL